jgi:hypothetical protein
MAAARAFAGTGERSMISRTKALSSMLTWLHRMPRKARRNLFEPP